MDLLVAMTLLVPEHNDNQCPRRLGLVKGRASALDQKREVSHVQLFDEYFHRTKPLYPAYMFR
jgi:hypothetical protein